MKSGKSGSETNLNSKLFRIVIPVCFFLFCPLLVMFCESICYEKSVSCSITKFQKYVAQHNSTILYTLKGYFLAFFELKSTKNDSMFVLSVMACWVLLQFCLHVRLRAKTVMGNRLHSNNVYLYRINGWRCWIISNVVTIAICYFIKGKINMFNFFVEHSRILVVYSCYFGFATSVLLFIKAYTFPTHKLDCQFLNNVTGILYAFFMGIERNPRVNVANVPLDLKLFFNTRIGIAAWPLINLSYAYTQYETFGAVTDSMVVLNILHLLYVADLFYYEEWYIKTIDMEYDNFGFYLAWGDVAWLPFMYTLQGYYLARNNVNLGSFYSVVVLLIGLLSYIMFREINNQRKNFREAITSPDVKHDKITTFGKRAKYIKMVNGETTGYMLCSGYWGYARHINYLPDLFNALSYGLCCGFSDFLPYFYFFYMIILLVHRERRDELKCRLKYGDANWDKYCKAVKYRIVPFIY